jgi:hypothetical protein
MPRLSVCAIGIHGMTGPTDWFILSLKSTSQKHEIKGDISYNLITTSFLKPIIFLPI